MKPYIKKKLIYVAGPYRASSAWGIEQNIRAAEKCSMELAEVGWMPVCPHSMTRYFNGTVDDDFWLNGTLELMRRCDAVFVCRGWEDSSGTRAEIDEAERLEIPTIYYNDNALRDGVLGPDDILGPTRK